jgi:hypothetical protein
MTPKGHFEINWPLGTKFLLQISCNVSISKYRGPKVSHRSNNHKTAHQSSTNELPDVKIINLGISVLILSLVLNSIEFKTLTMENFE